MKVTVAEKSPRGWWEVLKEASGAYRWRKALEALHIG
jgi:hypothetical protein